MFRRIATVLAAGILAGSLSMPVQAATGKVTASSVKVRESASTQSGHIFSLNMGDKVDIVSQEKDSSGHVWYKIALEEGGYGYVRSDLVQSDGPVSEETSAGGETTVSEEAPAYQQRKASVKAEKANVRGGAGTVHDSVGTVSGGTEVVVIGEDKGTDGKTWYQIQFDGDKTGYIRGDLIELGEVIQVSAPEEEAVPEDVVPSDVSDVQETSALSQAMSMGNGEYSLAYKADEAGLETWYLYDNVEGTQVKMTDLLNAANNGRAAEKLLKQNRTLKLILIVLAVVLVALFIFALLMGLRMRDLLYYDDDEFGAHGDDHTRKSQTGAHTAAQPQGKQVSARDGAGRASQPSKQSQSSQGRSVSGPERSGAGRGVDRMPSGNRLTEGRKEGAAQSSRGGSGRSEGSSAQSSRKRSSFGRDDEDFEFEFLDLDDKK